MTKLPEKSEQKDLSELSALNLDEDQKNEILIKRASGYSLQDIAKILKTSVGIFQAYLIKYPKYNKRFELASSKGYDTLAEELVNIAENTTNIAEAKLKSENVKWLLSKRKPKTYGDRIELDVKQSLDLSSALTSAKSRVVNAARKEDDEEPERKSKSTLIKSFTDFPE